MVDRNTDILFVVFDAKEVSGHLIKESFVVPRGKATPGVTYEHIPGSFKEITEITSRKTEDTDIELLGDTLQLFNFSIYCRPD